MLKYYKTMQKEPLIQAIPNTTSTQVKPNVSQFVGILTQSQTPQPPIRKIIPTKIANLKTEPNIRKNSLTDTEKDESEESNSVVEEIEENKNSSKVEDKHTKKSSQKSSQIEDKKINSQLKKTISKLPRDKNGKFAANPNKIKKEKIEKWDHSCKFVSINAPIGICHPKMKKKYVITFRYFKDGKIKQKTVKFGNREIDDYVDHKDEKKKERTMGSLRKYDNPLQPNYWRYNLLNRYSSLKDGYTNFLSENGLMI